MTQPQAATKKRVAIVQSSYIPWKGYFGLINTVDEFVLFDDVQYPEYRQLHGAFDHQVSIVDLMLNTGQAASRYLKTLAARVPRTG